MIADDLRPVIHVNAIAAPDAPREGALPGGREPLAVPAKDLRKSTDFYRRVFGFWPRPRTGGGPLLLAGHDGLELKLEPRAASAGAGLRRCTFVVSDLDTVREQVWDLGVKVARDSGEPDHIFRRRGRASLYVHDPDGNEIELVEHRHAAERAPVRLEPRRRLRTSCASERARVNAS
ncbi:MAG TPA: VOC family protein [Gammaproteobacteria bacterium]|jgi:catechol 2,3-dioxygenase-like lactoylglutathione lyase family enzyme|nr:VOC family protein [Gammaproteobacteria bacterium]